MKFLIPTLTLATLLLTGGPAGASIFNQYQNSNNDGYTTLAYFPVIVRQAKPTPAPASPPASIPPPVSAPIPAPKPAPDPLVVAAQNADIVCAGLNAPDQSRGLIDSSGDLIACYPMGGGCPVGCPSGCA